MKISRPPSRKKITISSDGTTPMKMYDRINFRRTRHSRRCFIRTKRRHTKIETDTTRPMVAAPLRTEINRGRSPARRSSATTSLSEAEIMKRRPGHVFSNRSRAEYGSSVPAAGAGRRLPGSIRSGTRGVLMALAAMITERRNGSVIQSSEPRKHTDQHEPRNNTEKHGHQRQRMKLSDSARFSTVCIHAGQEPDPST